MPKLPKERKQELFAKKAFYKDPVALKLVDMMTEPDFSEKPDAYIAKSLGISVQQLKEYQKDPDFLEWMGKRLPKLLKKRLPELLNTILEQGIAGKGRQQKMALELMGLLEKQTDTHSPNITVITNIPGFEVNSRKEVGERDTRASLP